MSLRLPRPLSRLGVVVPAGLVACGALLAVGAGTASAHVSVSSADAAPAATARSPSGCRNESDAASTVDVRIQLPTDTPLTSLRAQPVPGWSVTLTTAQLPETVQAEGGGEVTSAVSVGEYRAVPGGGIGPGEFQEFSLSGGPFPETDALTFNEVQTYTDGTDAAWLEPTVAGQAEPEHPAPVLTLSAGGTDAHGAATAAVSTPDGDGDGLAVAALVVAVTGLVAGLAGLVLGLAARRRTVSS
ncbi:Uncharacterized protein YcnI [Modestobacter sp. DSM 44400]|uniref:YcnI family copper-binding membrane protein n=1 Tax=Modestobacter sp. DSM 44400 TaxID=1550230 RepID=UPI00089AFFFD|nr:YcnI family protein [Modestobacter sp. DSM 44400]SDY28743.1 Uncharacterized protein YcnI [Modestobacter sp. DSM 44400]